MAQDTSIQFGQDPPLFSKPPGWKPPAAAQRPQDTFQAHNPIHRCLSSPCQILTKLQSSVVAPGQSWPLPLNGQCSRRSMVLGHTRPKSEPFCRDAHNGLLVQILPRELPWLCGDVTAALKCFYSADPSLLAPQSGEYAYGIAAGQHLGRRSGSPGRKPANTAVAPAHATACCSAAREARGASPVSRLGSLPDSLRGNDL